MAATQPILAQAAPQSKCVICGDACPPSRKKNRTRKFCSPECDKEWRRRRFTGNTLRVGLKPANSFATGHATWNRGMKGRHFSPATEFKKGQRAPRAVDVGTVTIRIDKSGNRRAWVKVAEPNKWKPRAVVNWETAHGRSVPRGYVVHHKDRDTLNDEPENLELQTRAEHIAEHRAENEQARRRGLRRRIAKGIVESTPRVEPLANQPVLF